MSKYHCPLCKNNVDQFLPLPDMYRQMAELHGWEHFGKGETINLESYSCPICTATDRERLCALWIEKAKNTELNRRVQMLHFAPEKSLSKFVKASLDVEYRSCDITGLNVDDKIDMTDMSYHDNTFNFFICSHVLEHVASDKAALKELFRVIAPGGLGILLAPIFTHINQTVEEPHELPESERWRLFGQGDHRRLYCKKDFVEKIELAGFNVEQLGVKELGEENFNQCAITMTSTLYIARKSIN